MKIRLEPREGPGGPKWHLIGRIVPKKSFADSQKGGESIARVRWQKIEGRYYREKEAGAEGGPLMAKMAPDWSNRAQKSSVDSQ